MLRQKQKESSSIPVLLGTLVAAASIYLGMTLLSPRPSSSIPLPISKPGEATNVGEAIFSYPAVSDPDALGKHLAFRLAQELAVTNSPGNYDPNNSEVCHKIEALIRALEILTYDSDPTKLIEKGMIQVFVKRAEPDAFLVLIKPDGAVAYISSSGLHTAYFPQGKIGESAMYRPIGKSDLPTLRNAWQTSRSIFEGKPFSKVVERATTAFNKTLKQLKISVGCRTN